MRLKHFFLSCLIFFIGSGYLFGQTSKEYLTSHIEKMGGVYYRLPVDQKTTQSPAPKGYKPFYISHYGRHGARYLINKKTYTYTLKIFEEARIYKALTPLGLEICNRLEKILPEIDERFGDLSPLGVKQHQLIAQEMYKNFPDVFRGNTEVNARSSTINRCVLSMASFCDELKGLNPKLQITRDVSDRYMNYIDFEGKVTEEIWKQQSANEYPRIKKCSANPRRLIKSIFTNNSFVYRKVNENRLMWHLFWIAEGMQDMQTKVSFFDIFTKDELFDIWNCANYTLYVMDGPGGTMPQYSKPLLNDFLECANKALKEDKPSVTLRFGHDTDIIPFTAFLKFENCYKTTPKQSDVYKIWDAYNIAPMGANIQFIFYKQKDSKDIIVKFLFNNKETLIPVLNSDILPYYHWDEVKKYFTDLLDK